MIGIRRRGCQRSVAHSLRSSGRQGDARHLRNAVFTLTTSLLDDEWGASKRAGTISFVRYSSFSSLYGARLTHTCILVVSLLCGDLQILTLAL